MNARERLLCPRCVGSGWVNTLLLLDPLGAESRRDVCDRCGGTGLSPALRELAAKLPESVAMYRRHATMTSEMDALHALLLGTEGSNE